VYRSYVVLSGIFVNCFGEYQNVYSCGEGSCVYG